MMAGSKGRENATIEPFDAVAVFFIFSVPGHRVRFYKSQLSDSCIHPLSLEALGVSSTFIL